MAKIEKVYSREVLDSRGNPTVETWMYSKNLSARAIVPSGASTGIHEALELRDNNKRRYFGKGVKKAVGNAMLLGKELVGINPKRQKFIDNKLIKLDGTPNKSKYGANAILSLSMASSVLAAKSSKKELFEYLAEMIWKDDAEKKISMPTPFSNIINGGKHAGNGLSIQEFMITPIYEKDFKEKVRIISEVYHELKSVIKEKYGKDAVNVGDEGGFALPLDKTRDALNLIIKAIDELGYQNKVRIAFDAAASDFYDKTKKRYFIDGREFKRDELLDYYMELLSEYKKEIISVEDPFDEDDFKGFSMLMPKLRNVQLVTDDLTVTNVKRIRKAIRMKAGNALLLKLNQIGTVTESIKAAKLAMDNNWKVMVSHRSGETEDTFIADLAVALGCGQIKIGAPCRGERTAKYNRLLRIYDKLKEKE